MTRRHSTARRQPKPRQTAQGQPKRRQTPPATPTREFHVSREARDRYGFDESLFGLHGNVVFANYAAARRFAQKMNEQRDLAADPGAAVRAGDISAMGLVDEILHFVVELYQRERNPDAMSEALTALREHIPPASLEDTLRMFAEHFPAVAAYRGQMSAEEYLAGETDGTPNREIVLEELLLLWLANGNDGFAPHGELFDDGPLEDTTAYLPVIRQLQAWFKTQPGFGPDDEDLVTLLRRPALDGGKSLAEQLRWIADKWGFAAEKFGDRLVVNLDVLTEEERAVWMRFNATQGGGADAAAAGGDSDSAGFQGFGELDSETERFSNDLAWMPRVVLLAKSTYVWLDQLSRAHGRPIWRLDQIPEEELDTIAARGFTGLWLIGLWERSVASREIKQLRGNPEAVASAYSLMDYRIADDLGGEEAYGNLRDRAWSRGIRLASDMVPNHMGIDSRWVVEHPDWFMQRPDAPYPVYSYNGPNLSNDERVGIYIEDHYFDNTDAAVTFKRADRWSGQERHVYHGNDGTSMPWNDTAQLDYIKPEVREAVIQTILAVARRFPIIRFDAAMTLAKRHIQRLWYPEPGTAGAIPSRAEYSMSKAAFDKAMPHEFWREVVDRVAAEAPDTLLLAEAFWLMEGYFVRTLGMHRVYNSAFMNMMRDEKNAEYRLVMKNTLEFDPQILKRYVNFMNNPDEKTAVDQFGKGDKYFGVATLLATMPGLPMFGHGQIEGFAERYGMEYRRAYLDETPDPELIARHEREIFPLLHRRALFAEVDEFAMYDFFTADGSVNEDVFAFSNEASEGTRSLVVYHNRFADTAGWIRTAAVTGRSLADGLSLGGGRDDYLVMRDGRTDLLYLRSHVELTDKGLYLELGGYTCHVFVEMYDVHDTDGRYGRLAAHLAGRGVPDLDDELELVRLAHLRDAFAALVSADLIRELGTARMTSAKAGASPRRKLSSDAADRARILGEQVIAEAGETDSTPLDAFVANIRAGLDAYLASTKRLPARMFDRPMDAAVVSFLAVRGLGGGSGTPQRNERCRASIDRWRLASIVAKAFEDAGFDGPTGVDGIRAIFGQPAWRIDEQPVGVAAVEVVRRWLDDEAMRRSIGVNEHDGVIWFDRDRFARQADQSAVIAAVRFIEMEAAKSGERASTLASTATVKPLADLARIGQVVDELHRLASESGYRVDRLVSGERQPTSTVNKRQTSPKRSTSVPEAKARPRTQVQSTARKSTST